MGIIFKIAFKFIAKDYVENLFSEDATKDNAIKKIAIDKLRNGNTTEAVKTIRNSIIDKTFNGGQESWLFRLFKSSITRGIQSNVEKYIYQQKAHAFCQLVIDIKDYVEGGWTKIGVLPEQEKAREREGGTGMIYAIGDQIEKYKKQDRYSALSTFKYVEMITPTNPGSSISKCLSKAKFLSQAEKIFCANHWQVHLAHIDKNKMYADVHLARLDSKIINRYAKPFMEDMEAQRVKTEVQSNAQACINRWNTDTNEPQA
jgi:hypothetical protein